MPPCKETKTLSLNLSLRTTKKLMSSTTECYRPITNLSQIIHIHYIFFCYINTLNTEKFYIRANNSTNQCNNCSLDSF